MLNEIAKQLEFARGEADGLPITPHLCSPQIDSDLSKMVNGSFTPGRGPRASQQRLNPRKELDHGEGFGHTIIRAHLQPYNFIRRLVPGRQHQDGRVQALLAEVAAHVNALVGRARQVENDQVKMFIECKVCSFGAVANELDGPPMLPQAIGQGCFGPGLVLNQKYSFVQSASLLSEFPLHADSN